MSLSGHYDAVDQVDTLRAAKLAIRSGLLIAILSAAACGGPFNSTAMVKTVEGQEVCIVNTTDDPESPARPTDCFQTDEVDGDDTFSVGECVRMRHAGESGRITRATIVECDDGASSE